MMFRVVVVLLLLYLMMVSGVFFGFVCSVVRIVMVNWL